MNILIVDDEKAGRERLQRLLNELGYDAPIRVAENSLQALQHMQQQSPELILLDIQMPGLDGLQLAQQWAQQTSPPKIIFCTAHEQYALQAFDIPAVGYLLKPVRKEKLQQALQRLTPESMAKDSVAERLKASRGRSQLWIPLDQVSFFRAEDKYVTVHYLNTEAGPSGPSAQQALVDESLKQLEQRFGEQLMRIHRNCLVARQRVKQLYQDSTGGRWLSLEGYAEPLAVSKRHFAILKKQP